MHSIKTQLFVPEEHELRIIVPDTIPTATIAEISITFWENNEWTNTVHSHYHDKLEQLRDSTTDPLFNADIIDVGNNFYHTDREFPQE